jgi:hypothetical protein
VSRQTIFDPSKSLTKKWDTLLRIIRNMQICKFAGSLQGVVGEYVVLSGICNFCKNRTVGVGAAGGEFLQFL